MRDECQINSVESRANTAFVAMIEWCRRPELAIGDRGQRIDSLIGALGVCVCGCGVLKKSAVAFLSRTEVFGGGFVYYSYVKMTDARPFDSQHHVSWGVAQMLSPNTPYF